MFGMVGSREREREREREVLLCDEDGLLQITAHLKVTCHIYENSSFH